MLIFEERRWGQKVPNKASGTASGCTFWRSGGGDKQFPTEPLAPLAGARLPMAGPAYFGVGAIDAWQDHVKTRALLFSKSLATAIAASGPRIRLDTF